MLFQIFALLCKYCWKKCINFGSYQSLYLSTVKEYIKKRPFFYNICTTMQIFDVVRPVWVLFGLLAILCKYFVLNLKISTSCSNIVEEWTSLLYVYLLSFDNTPPHFVSVANAHCKYTREVASRASTIPPSRTGVQQ